MTKRYFECGCTAEVLRIEVDCFGDDEHIKEFMFSIYERPNNRYPLWHRIKHAFHVLKYNRPHADSLCLDVNQACELMVFLRSELEDNMKLNLFCATDKEPEK